MLKKHSSKKNHKLTKGIKNMNKREIKFRGISEDTGLFVYGLYVQGMYDGISKNVGHGIYREGCYPIEVIEGTINQFTGMQDRYGADIYERDIVRWYGLNIEVKSIVDGWFAESFDGMIKVAGQELASCCSVVGNMYESALLLEEI